MAIHPSQIRVVAPFIGGGFGGKLSVRVEPHAVLLARMTGRPVKIVLTREEEFISGHPRHPFRLKYKTGVKMDGRITAREIRFLADSGAYAHQGPGVIGTAASRAQGPYQQKLADTLAPQWLPNRYFGDPPNAFRRAAVMTALKRVRNAS